MRAEGSLTARAVRANPMSAIQQSFIMNCGQNVPYTLDVVVVQSNVRIIKIGPISDSFRKFTPLLLVTEDARFTLLNKFLDTVFLDLLLA
ncbi:hypothetical protein D1872_292380 [compost metagenome]